MWISINKEWFEKNKQKFLEESDQIDEYVISVDGEKDIVEVNGSNICFSEDRHDQIYVSFDHDFKTETIVQLVENAIDDIKGESLAKIVELIVKKLNKLRSFLESIKGL